MPRTPAPLPGLVHRLVSDVVPAAGTALLLGPHDAEILDAVATRVGDVTLLLNEIVEPPAALDRVRVVRGTLDQAGEVLAAAGWAPTFDLVLAVPGLDDLHDPGGMLRTWDTRLATAAALVAPGGTLVVGAVNDVPVTALVPGLVGRPPARRTPDGRPTTEDDTAPASAAQFRRALTGAGHPVSTVHCLFGAPESPGCILADDVAEACRPGELSGALALAAMAPDTGGATLDASWSLMRAGLLPALATGWVAVSGGRCRAGYAVQSGSPLALDWTADGAWSVEGLEPSDGLEPRTLPGTPCVEARMRRALRTDDFDALRSIATAFGDWVRAGQDGTGPWAVAFDGLYLDDDRFMAGLGAPAPAAGPDATREVIIGAWIRFAKRLAPEADRWPTWGAWTDPAGRLRTWLGLSGVDLDPDIGTAILARATIGGEAPVALPPDAAPPSADEALAGRVEALVAAIATRDEQLRHREQYIRQLRRLAIEATRGVDDAERRNAALLRSRTYVLGRRVEAARDPRTLAREVARRGTAFARRLLRVLRG